MSIPNSWMLDDTNALFFDLFHKNDKIYVIMPWYDKLDINEHDISLFCNNIEIPFETKMFKDTYTTLKIIIYRFQSENYINTITVKYKDLKRSFLVHNIKTTTNKKLTLTTLFKDDYKLISVFYDYYKKQGVEHFYMYYNGKLTDDVKKYYDHEDITLIEWNFLYHNSNCRVCPNHAQPSQMQHAIYRYGKDSCEYMAFCDLDEFMNTYNESRLIDLVTTKNLNTYIFLNRWAKIIDGNVPIKLPTTFLASDPLEYAIQSKCIHKIDPIIFVDIHYGSHYWSGHSSLERVGYLYHFYNWCQTDRLKDTDHTVTIKY